MYFKSKKVSLFLLFLTAMISSRVMFFFFDDPEGPNLLIVTVSAIVVYSLSLIVYLSKYSKSKLSRINRFLLTILSQILIVTIFFLLLV